MITTVSILIFIINSCFVQYNGINVVTNNMKNLFSDVSSMFKVTKDRITNTEIKTETEKKLEKAGSGRAKIWKYGLKIFLDKPILGYGADNLESEYRKYNIRQDRPHNLIIQLATTSGLPGCILYIIAIGLILARAFKRLNNSNRIYTIVFFAIIAYLISAMFGNSMYYTSPYYFIFLGIIFSITIRHSGV